MSDAIKVITSLAAIRCRGQVNLLGIPQYSLHPVLLFPTQATFINFPEGFVVWFLLVIADIVFSTWVQFWAVMIAVIVGLAGLGFLFAGFYQRYKENQAKPKKK